VSGSRRSYKAVNRLPGEKEASVHRILTAATGCSSIDVALAGACCCVGLEIRELHRNWVDEGLEGRHCEKVVKSPAGDLISLRPDEGQKHLTNLTKDSPCGKPSRACFVLDGDSMRSSDLSSLFFAVFSKITSL
jgi:hypothetical protein